MIANLSEYFNQNYQYYLESINYTKIDSDALTTPPTMDAEDRIESQLDGRKVKITLTRTIKFVPETLFSLTISFGAILTFNDNMYSEQDWDSVDMAEEFIHGGGFVLNHLISRITLLVAQITSSFGQPPLFIPLVSDPIIDNSQSL